MELIPNTLFQGISILKFPNDPNFKSKGRSSESTKACLTLTLFNSTVPLNKLDYKMMNHDSVSLPCQIPNFKVSLEASSI